MTNRRPLLGLVLGAVLTTAGCSADSAGGVSPPAASPPTTSTSTTVPPAEFASELADESIVVVNVHVPDEGSIPGTDVAIPFEELRARSAELPQDRRAPLAVYCKSGRMSSDAVSTLRDLGYTDVIELRGGMDAWAADGRDLLRSTD